MGSPAGDKVAHGTAAATDPRPLNDRVSESGDINPGHAGYRSTSRNGDHRPPARSAEAIDWARATALNVERHCATSAKNIPWRGNLVAFTPNAKTFWKNISSNPPRRDQFVTASSVAVVQQNYPLAALKVKSIAGGHSESTAQQGSD